MPDLQMHQFLRLRKVKRRMFSPKKRSRTQLQWQVSRDPSQRWPSKLLS